MEKIESCDLFKYCNFTENEFRINNYAPSKLSTVIFASVLVTLFVVLREIKEALKRGYLKNVQKKDFYPLLNTISLSLIPLVFLFICFFALLKQTVNFILKLKYRGKYRCILSGGDAIWTIDKTSRGIVNVLAIVENNDDETLEYKIMKTLEKTVFSSPHKFPKLTCSLHHDFGYYYLMDNLKVENCTKTFDTDYEYFDKEQLKYILSEVSNQELSNSGLWEIVVGKKPLDTQKNTYPVILRFSHVVGDGSSMISFLLSCLADNGNLSANNLNEIASKLLKKNKNLDSPICKFFNNVFEAPSVILDQTLFREDSFHILHKKSLSGTQNIAWKIEDIGNNCVYKIKYIKDTLKIRFNDVVLCLISTSISNFFRNKCLTPPKNITVVLPVLFDIPKYAKIPKLQNRFSVALIDLPILITSSFLRTAEIIHRETNRIQSAPDYLVNGWLFNIVSGVLPSQILKHILKADKVAMCVTNVPGTEKLNVCGGCLLKNIIFFPPHKGSAGINISIMTYDNKLHIGLIADKSLLTSVDCQKIIDTIFENITSFNNEIMNSF